MQLYWLISLFHLIIGQIWQYSFLDFKFDQIILQFFLVISQALLDAIHDESQRSEGLTQAAQPFWLIRRFTHLFSKTSS